MAVLNKQVWKLFAVSVALIMLLCATASAQSKPRIALSVTAKTMLTEKERNVLLKKFLVPFTKSGRYAVIDNSEGFAREAAEEMERSGGSSSIGEMARIGRKYRAKYICMVELDDAFERWNISARMVDVDAEEIYLAQGELDIPLENLQATDFTRAAREIFNQIHDSEDRRQSQIRESEDRRQRATYMAQIVAADQKKKTMKNIVAVSLDVAGAGVLAYGIYQDYNISSRIAEGGAVKSDISDMTRTRNICYIVGGTLLLSGISIHIFF